MSVSNEPTHSWYAVCRDGAPPAVKDGCRFRGTLTVNKVAGNFHITAGKYVPLVTY